MTMGTPAGLQDGGRCRIRPWRNTEYVPGRQFAIFIQVSNRGRFCQYISLPMKYTVSGSTLQYKVGLTLSFLSLISRGVGPIQKGTEGFLETESWVIDLLQPLHQTLIKRMGGIWHTAKYAVLTGLYLAKPAPWRPPHLAKKKFPFTIQTVWCT